MSQFTIDLDTNNRRVYVVQSGFWDEDDLARYASELRTALQRLSHLPGRGALVVDLTEQLVQSAEMNTRISAVFVELADLLPPYVAIASPSALVKMQAGRIKAATEDGHSQFETRFFADVPTALEWLATQA
ncbi:MAG TPA: hypothetical protein VNT42_11385 [Sphingomonas sp.]|nr:hypothetical protein [Sphingomonas sp.]